MKKRTFFAIASAMALFLGACHAKAADDDGRSSEEASLKIGTTTALGTYAILQNPPLLDNASLGISGKIAHIFEESLADCSQQIARFDRNEAGPSSMIECSMSAEFRVLSILRQGVETMGMQTIYFGALFTARTDDAVQNNFLGRDLSRPFIWSKVNPNEVLRRYGLPCQVSLKDSGDRAHVQSWSGTCSWDTFLIGSVDHKIAHGNGVIILTDSNKVVAIELVNP